jgi:hypothetical protein
VGRVVVVVVAGSDVVVVEVVSPSVVRLVECNGGGLWPPARLAGVAAQPAVMIPITPATSIARMRPPRLNLRVTGSLLPRQHHVVVG